MEHPGRRAPGCRDGGDPACADGLVWNPSGFIEQSLGLPVFRPGTDTASEVLGGPILFAPPKHFASQPLAGPPIAAHNHPTGDAASAASWASGRAVSQGIPQADGYLRLHPSPAHVPWMGPSVSTAAPAPAGTVGWASTSCAVSPVAAAYDADPISGPDMANGLLDFPFGQALDSELGAVFDASGSLTVPFAPWSDASLRLSPAHSDLSSSAALLVEDSSSTFSTLHNSRPPSASPSISFVYDAVSANRASVVGQQKKRKARTRTPTLEIIHFKPDESPPEDRPKKRRANDTEGTAGNTSRTLKKVTYEDENGEMRGIMMTFGNPEHHRSRFTPEKRLETKLARREGVCSRCQASKRKCDLALKDSLYVPCTRCSTSRLYKNVSPLPCFKSILKEVMFFRDGPAANEPFFTERFKRLTIEDISKPNVPVRNLQLTQRVGHKLMIYASEFVPLPGDKVSLAWKDARGNQREMRMPPFCLTNMQKVTAQVCQYIYVAKQSYLQSHALSSGDELERKTVKVAMEYAKAKPGSLVAMALDLWAISRMIEIEWEMCGPDTLGVSEITDPTDPRRGKIPIPPMMDTQLDQIVIKEVLYPLKQKFLDQFEARISPMRTEDWFDIYLTSFVVLDHIERLACHSAHHANLHAMPSKFSNVSFLTNVFHTAKVILSRFHFVCNGSAPLALDWDSPSAQAMSKLDSDQIAFMKETQALIKARDNDIISLRTTHNYGSPLYWSSQLFTREWDDSPARVIEVT
ncbi:hypothetical protein B0T14DRAFT_136514 [Immersiella caudata]|uniref:Zn(2)-C6 fungal-type domain-containing protein n=1 Tax=Immersiella caudata TaxID=314043 RepID=A0AA39X5B3_9PEZI|nr:hypothetical protein B0T14DRAFT_136514 [Immersiella caudata]